MHVSISTAILVAGLAMPEAAGQPAKAPFDNMPIFGMPDRVNRNGGTVNFRIPVGRYLGIEMGIETQDLAGGRAAAREGHGVEVTQVDAGSPAAKAGFKTGDIVLDYNGQAVEGKAQLSRFVNETLAGQQVKIGVSRAGARLTLTPAVDASQYRPPTLIREAEPEFTPEARKAGIEGTVLVEAEIGADGRVYHARVDEGLGYGLDDKAMEAVAKWLFSPGTNHGVPVNFPATLEVNFRRQR